MLRCLYCNQILENGEQVGIDHKCAEWLRIDAMPDEKENSEDNNEEG